MTAEYEAFIEEARARFRAKQKSPVHGSALNAEHAAAIDVENTAASPMEPVGDEFYSIVQQLGLYVPCSLCAATRAKMNRLGVAGCRERFDELVQDVHRNMEVLQSSGRLKRTLWTDMKTAAAAIRHGIDLDLLNPIAGLLRTAISRVESRK